MYFLLWKNKPVNDGPIKQKITKQRIVIGIGTTISSDEIAIWIFIWIYCCEDSALTKLIHCKCKLKCWLNKEFENKLSHKITDKWRLDRNENYFYYWMKRGFYCDIKQASNFVRFEHSTDKLLIWRRKKSQQNRSKTN